MNKVVPLPRQQLNSNIKSQSDSAVFGLPTLQQTPLSSGPPTKQQVPQSILGGYPPLSAQAANQAYGIQQQAYNSLYNPTLGQKVNNVGGYMSNPLLNPPTGVVNPNQQLQGSYWAQQAANNIPLGQQQNSGYYDSSGFLNNNLGSASLLNNNPSQYIPTGTAQRPVYGQDVSGMVHGQFPVQNNIQQGSIDKYIGQGDRVSDSGQYGGMKADNGRHIPIGGSDVDGQYVLDDTGARHFLSDDGTNPVRHSNLDPFLRQNYNNFKKGDQGNLQGSNGNRQYIDHRKNVRKSTTLAPTTKPTTTTTSTTTTTTATLKPTTLTANPVSESSLDETQFSNWGNSQDDGNSLGDNRQNGPHYPNRGRGRGGLGQGRNAPGRKFHSTERKTGKQTKNEARRHKGGIQGNDKFGRYQNNNRNRPVGGRKQTNGKNRYPYYDDSAYHNKYPNYNYDFDNAYYDFPNSNVQMNRPVNYDYENYPKGTLDVVSIDGDVLSFSVTYYFVIIHVRVLYLLAQLFPFISTSVNCQSHC